MVWEREDLGSVIMDWSLIFLGILWAPSVMKSMASVSGKQAWDHRRPLPRKPFLTIWNAPVSRCSQKYGVDLDLGIFDFVVNPDEEWVGQFMTIFYNDEMGLYPYYTSSGLAVNHGIPQLVNLQQHLTKVRSDIIRAIPDPDFSGLAVIDWEAWRPLWIRNWDKKTIYKAASENVVRKQHPDWNATHVTKEAQQQFEIAARAMMEQTIYLAKQLRPRGRWGYYLFPECYNYGGESDCDSATKQANDRLLWLFNASSSLFPSAYLSGTNFTKHKNFVFGQLMESLRVTSKLSPGGATPPIFLYSRYEYSDIHVFRRYYIKEDLSTILSQASDLGAAGVIFWGDTYSESNYIICKGLKKYIDTTLGPLVREVTLFTVTCSMELCHNHGRCVKLPSYIPRHLPKNVLLVKETDHNLKLNFNVLRMHKGNVYIKNNNDVTYDTSLEDRFPGYSCNCYAGWSGKYCDHQFVVRDWWKMFRAMA